MTDSKKIEDGGAVNVDEIFARPFMTSSPADSIEKAMEGAELTQRECVFAAQEDRKANGADTYPSRVLDKAAGVIANLARQAEAMKREMAEKDARIAALEVALKPFAAHRTADGINGPGSPLHIPDNHPLLFNGLGSDTHVTVTVGDVRRARALIGGGNAGD